MSPSGVLKAVIRNESSLGEELPEIRFTNLDLSRLKAQQPPPSSASSKFQNGGTALASLQRGGKWNAESRTSFKAFTKKYNQTLAAGESAMLDAPNSRERVAAYRVFNAKVADTMQAAKNLGMSRQDLGQLQKDLFRPLLGEASPTLKGSPTEQVRTVANRYGFTEVARRLNADKKFVQQFTQVLRGKSRFS